MALTPDTTRPAYDHDLPTTSIVSPAEDMRTMALHSISWSAVFAGAVIALVLQIILNMVGLGIGFSTVDPAGSGTPTAGSLSMGAGIWFVVSSILASAAGGYLAGRLSGKPSNSTTAYHGLIAWAVSTLVVVYLLSSAVGGVISGASSAVSSTLGGASSLIGGTVQTAATAGAPWLTKLTDPFSGIESSVRNGTGNDPEALKNAAVSAMRAAVTGDAAQQKDAQEKAAQALAKSQNIPVEQAWTQVGQYVQQFNDTVAKTKEQAKKTADAAARIASEGALFGALALLFGALAAFFAGGAAAVDPVLTRTAVAATPTERRV